MAHLRSICAAIILGSAITSRSSAAQAGAVSLTHIVSVTVPPRIRVKVESGTAAPSTVQAQKQSSTHGLSLSINATQPWSLSIGARNESQLQWSRDTSETIFIRPASRPSTQSSGDDDDAPRTVMLTIVAQ